MKKVSVSDIEPLVAEKNGNIAAIARALRVDRHTIDRRMNESPMLKQAIEDAREGMLDNAESVLYREILNGNMTAVIFFLKTQGRKRGYVERQEFQHSGEIAMPTVQTIVVTVPEAEDGD